MRQNKLLEAWRAGKKTLNGWCSMPAPFGAEVMANAGWDSVTIDTQHGLIGYDAMVPMLQAISTTDAVPMVRVPWLEAGALMKALDAGAMGVICPMVNTAADAEALVSWCRYPPKGSRSFGPIRASVYAGADYARHADDEVLVLAMIETRQALDNLDAILAVQGLNGVYVGPADLSNSMGYKPGFDPSEPAVVEAIGAIRAAAKGRGLFAGIHTGSAPYAKRMLDEGYDFVTMLSDSRFIAMKSRELIDAVRDQAQAPGGGAASY